VLDRIAPTALPRSSIIVSDEPLSAETNYRTEFVAVLSNQPQGGFITRKPTPTDVMAEAEFGDGFGSIFGRGGWGSQPGYSSQRNPNDQRGWGTQSGPQRGWGPQGGGNPGWGGNPSGWGGGNGYYRREDRW